MLGLREGDYQTLLQDSEAVITYTCPSSWAMVKAALIPLSSMMEQLLRASHIVPDSARPVKKSIQINSKSFKISFHRIYIFLKENRENSDWETNQMNFSTNPSQFSRGGGEGDLTKKISHGNVANTHQINLDHHLFHAEC